MNPLTLVKRIQSINSKEADLGISEEASWHAKYKDSAYVFVGGISYDLSEGDLVAVFAQYGEVVDINLVRDKDTGKSKGFAFLAYEDQRSTTLAVDNLNGAQVLGRIIRVDHCSKYVKREEEDDETRQQKREARGVCRAFQRGECTRGSSCKFSHDEKRAANTGWGHEEDRSTRWDNDKFDGMEKGGKSYGDRGKAKVDDKDNGALEHDGRRNESRVDRRERDYGSKSRGGRDEKRDRRSTRDDDDDDYDGRKEQKRVGRIDDRSQHKSRRHDDDDDDYKRRDDKRSRRHMDDKETRPRRDHKR